MSDEDLLDMILDYAINFEGKNPPNRAAGITEIRKALAAHDRAIKAETWDEGYSDGFLDERCGQVSTQYAASNPYRSTP